jgi:hypothetical protein
MSPGRRVWHWLKRARSDRLRIALGHGASGAGHDSLSDRLGDFGLSRRQGAELEESLRENHLVLAIEVYQEASLTAVFQVLQNLAAEKIMPVGAHAPAAKSGPRLFRRRSAATPTAAALTSLPAFA